MKKISEKSFLKFVFDYEKQRNEIGETSSEFVEKIWQELFDARKRISDFYDSFEKNSQIKIKENQVKSIYEKELNKF